MIRTIHINKDEYNLDFNNPVIRYKHNPILTCHNVNSVWEKPHLKTITVHNSGVTEYDGNVLLLFRSHLRNGVSVIGKAISNNGIDNWKI